MNERNFAIKTIEKIKDGGYASELMDKIPGEMNYSLVRQLVYGVVENDILLEWTIKQYLKNPNKKIPSLVDSIL